jgi:hypothetical protein
MFTVSTGVYTSIVKEIVHDLRHQLSATLEHVPNLGQVGTAELDQPVPEPPAP